MWCQLYIKSDYIVYMSKVSVARKILINKNETDKDKVILNTIDNHILKYKTRLIRNIILEYNRQLQF